MIQLPEHLGSICFPMGGAGNHLRWLLFLDKKFTFKRITTIEEKINFINQKVYLPERTWYNWLNFEFKFRVYLDSVLTIKHFLKDIPQNNKILLLHYTNTDNLFDNFYYLNVNLFSQSMDEFWSQIENSNNQIQIIDDKNTKVLLADSILDPELDYSFYKQVVDFFDLSDHYQEAKIIHSLYYNARNRAFKDFYNHFMSSKFHDYCNNQLNKRQIDLREQP